MRIWIINHYAVPSGGSIGSRHAVLAKYLRQAGHEVTVIAASLIHGTNIESHLKQFEPNAVYLDEKIDGVKWRFIKTKTYSNNFQRLKLMFDFHNTVLKSYSSLGKPDVVIGSCVHPFAVEAARKISKQYEIPFVYEIRDLWPESLVDVGGINRWHPACLLFREMERKAFRDASGVITLLPGMESYVAERGLSPERICYLPNGIDADRCPKVNSPVNNTRFVCTYFGAHGVANDLENIIGAAEIVQRQQRDDIRIQLIGDGACKQSLIDSAVDKGLSNLSFLDPVNKLQLTVFAEESDAFLFNLKPMPVIEKYGLSSNKLFEYLMYARPVVFACESFNNPIQVAGAGLSIAPGSPMAMANAILELSRINKSTLTEMGMKGRNYVLEHHCLKKLGNKLMDYLGEVIKSYNSNLSLEIAA